MPEEQSMPRCERLPSAAAQSRAARYRIAAGFALVLALTIVARTYGIENESIWFDEGVSVQFLDRPTFTEFIQAERMVDKLKMPLYFIAEYYWWHATGRSITALRYMSVLVAAATVTVLFLFTRKLWGAHTGLIAAFCFALSKSHIFHGQEIRMYGTMYLLALLSWYTLYFARGGNPRAWALHIALNFLLFATHLLGAVSFVAQAAFLMTETPRNWKRLIAWGVLHALIVLPFLPWLTSFTEYDRAIEWIPDPSFNSVWNSAAFVYLGTKINRGDPLSQSETIAAVALAIIAYTAAGAAIAREWRSAAGRSTAIMLLCWLVFPGSVLLAISYAASPCYVDRYVLYASFPLYMMLARGITLAPAKLAVCGAAAVLSIYSYSVAEQTRPVRPDVAAAAAHIAAHSEKNDALFVKGQGYKIGMKTYMANDTVWLLEDTVTLNDAIRMVKRNRRIWFVFPDTLQKYPLWHDQIDKAARQGGLTSSYYKVPGFHPVHLFVLSKSDGRGRQAAI